MNFDYEIIDDLITLYFHDEQETSIEIKTLLYWNWITENNYNDWVSDFYSPAQHDGHGQETGTYTKEEYFNLPYETIKKDLIQYLQKPKFKKLLLK